MTTLTERDAALELAHLIIASDKIGIVLLSGEDKQLVGRQLIALHEEAALYRKALTLRPLEEAKIGQPALFYSLSRRRGKDCLMMGYRMTPSYFKETEAACFRDSDYQAEERPGKECKGWLDYDALAALAVRGEK